MAVEAGQPFVLEDAAGNVIVRDRGVIRHTALFDTLGDGTPGAEFIEETHTSVHGPHPGFAEDFPFCEIAPETAILAPCGPSTRTGTCSAPGI